MDLLTPIVLIVVAYGIGSIPFSFLVVRMFAREDIRRHGSGNVGATNVLRNFGKRPGLIALLLDLGKGWLATAAALYLVASPHWPLAWEAGADWIHSPSFWIGLTGLVAVLGHVFPLWLDFHGGKGVATAAGVFLAMAPQALAAGMIIFVLVLVLSRYVSLASILAAAMVPIWIRFATPAPFWITIFSIAIALVVIMKHSQNIARIARGEERKFPR